MIYQAEVADDNPFYQIFLKNIDSGAVTQVSPGTGKTTCAWVHPAEEKVLFSSTHDDAGAKAKMVAEIERRKSGERQSYAWDYDEYYDIYETDFTGGKSRISPYLGVRCRSFVSPMASSLHLPPIAERTRKNYPKRKPRCSKPIHLL